MNESVTPLERFRTDQGLSQERLASLAGVSRDAITAIEKRSRRPMRLTLVKIARALGVQVDDLIEEAA